MASVLSRTHPQIAKLLTELHTLSENQDSQGVGISALNTQNVTSRDFSVFKDKMVALEQDKSELIYTILRQKRATRIFEAGTSYGVSTIYLVLAALENATNLEQPTSSLPPAVWGTEKESHKAQCARDNIANAFQTSPDSIPNFKLLQGDILEQVADARIENNSIDAVLFDIWAELALPTFKLLEKSLKPDAVLFVDNWTTGVQIGTYTNFKKYLESLGWYFVTLPYKNGLGMAVKGN